MTHLHSASQPSWGYCVWYCGITKSWGSSVHTSQLRSLGKCPASLGPHYYVSWMCRTGPSWKGLANMQMHHSAQWVLNKCQPSFRYTAFPSGQLKDSCSVQSITLLRRLQNQPPTAFDALGFGLSFQTFPTLRKCWLTPNKSPVRPSIFLYTHTCTYTCTWGLCIMFIYKTWGSLRRW